MTEFAPPDSKLLDGKNDTLVLILSASLGTTLNTKQEPFTVH